VLINTWKQETRKAMSDTVRAYGVTPKLIGIYWTDVPAWDPKQQKRVTGTTWWMRRYPAEPEQD